MRRGVARIEWCSRRSFTSCLAPISGPPAYVQLSSFMYGPKNFDYMDRDDRVRACYQHCALKWVMSERMTNQSLRERFRVPESKSAIVSQVIAATIEVGLVKADESVGASRKFARYLPFWA